MTSCLLSLLEITKKSLIEIVTSMSYFEESNKNMVSIVAISIVCEIFEINEYVCFDRVTEFISSKDMVNDLTRKICPRFICSFFSMSKSNDFHSFQDFLVQSLIKSLSHILLIHHMFVCMHLERLFIELIIFKEQLNRNNRYLILSFVRRVKSHSDNRLLLMIK